MTDNSEQIAFWNGEGGRRWVQQNHEIDAMIRPIGEATLDAAAPVPGERALDVGCGCGNQTIALAQRIGHGGRVLGVDVSEPMLALARRTAATDAAPRAALDFVQADAATQDFGAGGFDLLFSRFGVMFFAEPAAAFANLRRALRPGGRLAFCCWQPMRVNELMWLPLQAALQHLPAPAPVPPEAPGPFAFADAARVRGILEGAGFGSVRIDALERTLWIGEGLDAAATAGRLLDLGPAARMLGEASPEARAAVQETLREQIARRLEPRGLAITARCWLVQAASP